MRVRGRGRGSCLHGEAAAVYADLAQPRLRCGGEAAERLGDAAGRLASVLVRGRGGTTVRVRVSSQGQARGERRGPGDAPGDAHSLAS